MGIRRAVLKSRGTFAAVVAVGVVALGLGVGASPAAAATTAPAKVASQTMIWSSANTAAYGTSVTLLIAVTSSAATRTGVVTVWDGDVPIIDLTLESNSTARIEVPSLTLTTHSFRAVYAGDALNLPSTSATKASFTGTKGPVEVTLSAPSNAQVAGTTTTIYASACAINLYVGAPTGSLKISVGSTVVTAKKTGSYRACADYSADVRVPAAGSHALTGTFTGTGMFLSATDNTEKLVSQAPRSAATVASSTKLPTTVALTNSAPKPSPGATGSLTAKVCNSKTTAAPTGALAYTVGATKITGKLSSTSGSCRTYTASYKVPAVGSVKLTAAFTGTGSFASASKSTTMTSRAWATTTTAKLSVTKVRVGAAAKATVTIVAPGSGQKAPGKVTLKVNGVTIKSATVSNGIATLTIPTGKVQTAKIQVVFTPSSTSFGASTSATSTLTIVK